MRVRLLYYPNREIRVTPSSDNARVQRRPARGDRPLDIKCKVAHDGPCDRTPDSTPILKPGYGGVPRQTEFSNRSHRSVLRLSGALDESPGVTLFFTGTLPGSTPEALDAISRYSAQIVHRLLTWLGQQAKKTGNELLTLYCWELQKRGALHLHLLIRVQSDAYRAMVDAGIERIWWQILSGLSTSTGIDFFERELGGSHALNPAVWQSKLVEITGFAGAYIGKYLGKSTSKSGDFSYYPTRWWGASSALRELYRSLIVNVQLSGDEGEMASWIDRMLERIPAAVVSAYQYVQRFVGRRINVYYLSESAGQSIVEYVQANPPPSKRSSRLPCPYNWHQTWIFNELKRQLKNEHFRGNFTRFLDRNSVHFWGQFLRDEYVPPDEYFALEVGYNRYIDSISLQGCSYGKVAVCTSGG